MGVVMGSDSRINFQGYPVIVAGKRLNIGDLAPEFNALVGLKVITLNDIPAKPRLFNVVPSIDTSICARQTSQFSTAIEDFGDRVAAYTFSMDLPFAQNRFFQSSCIRNMTPVSDCYDHSFGVAYGVLVTGFPLRLLTRAVFVIDSNGFVRYADYVSEITDMPDFNAAIKALNSLV
jgi:thiol peroxidase